MYNQISRQYWMASNPKRNNKNKKKRTEIKYVSYYATATGNKKLKMEQKTSGKIKFYFATW